MAQKGGYPRNPPPAYAPPGVAVYNVPNTGQNTTVIVQGQPRVITKSSGGFFGSLDSFGRSLSRDLDKVGNVICHGIGATEHHINHAFPTTNSMTSIGAVTPGLFGQLGRELNLLGKTVSREIDWTADQINKSLATTAQGNILNLFQSGNVIQLVSRCSGRSLQILQGPSALVLDGLGQDEAPNVTWTVVNEGSNQVRLHNNNNFMAVINGSAVIINMPPGAMHGIETKFQLTQRGQFIHLESLKERGRHIGILQNGQLKAALATGKEDHSMFGVRLKYSPYGVTTPAK